jgi:hypothetical protein
MRALLVRLADLAERGREHSEDRHRVSTELIEILRRAPDTANLLANRLRGESCRDGEAKHLLGILGAAGTEEAQRELLEILGDVEAGGGRRELAVVALVQVERPVPAVDDTLLRLSRGRGRLSRTALLVLADVGRKVEEDAPRRGRVIRHEVETAARGARTIGERTLALDALGNLGADRILPVVADGLAHRERRIRKAASRALLRVRSREADEILARAAREDPDPVVREAAIDVLVRRQMEGHASREETGAWLRSLLGELARADADENVRDFAARSAARIG